MWYNIRKKEDIMERKDMRIYIRVSAEENERIKAKAKERHLTVSAYVRQVVLDKVEGRNDD